MKRKNGVCIVHLMGIIFCTTLLITSANASLFAGLPGSSRSEPLIDHFQSVQNPEPVAISNTSTPLATANTFVEENAGLGTINSSYDCTSAEKSGNSRPVSQIVAAIDVQLLNAIDELAGSTDSAGNYIYFKKSWKLNIDQYKAWIATIAWSEGCLGGYSAHSQSLGDDKFYHQDPAVGSKFCFSAGIGPFQIDSGHYLGDDDWGPWDQWATIDKLDYRRALVSVLKQHYNQFPDGSTLGTFTQRSKWIGTSTAARCWEEVTGTKWTKYSNGIQALSWPEIKDDLSRRAIGRGDMSYESQIIFKGPIQWSITTSDKDTNGKEILTDSRKQVVFDGQYPTWLIAARNSKGDVLYNYYYTYRPEDKLEVWAWPANCDTNFRYIFVRDYSKIPINGRPQAQKPDHISKGGRSAGFTLTHSALFSDNTPPIKPSTPSGQQLGVPKTTYPYSTLAKDPDGAQVKYTFDWEDSQFQTGWYNSGTLASASHSWSKAGTYQVKAKATNCFDSEWSDPLEVIINTPPNAPSKPPIGSTKGYAWVPYTYTISATDPDGDQLRYIFEWWDSTPTTMTDPVDSGTPASAIHSWTKAGTYSVKARAIDNNWVSKWSASITVRIAANDKPNTPTAPFSDSGTNSGSTGTLYSYSTSATDPNRDQVKYTFDWGDNEPRSQTSLVKSGTLASASHAWSAAETYPVTAMATDSKGASSGWSDPIMVTISSSADVCPQGCKYSCIQAAIDAANPGDTIHVAEGTYKAEAPCESIHIDKSLTIKGAGEGKTIVDGNQAGSVFTIGKIDPNINVNLYDMLIRNGVGTLESGYVLGGGILNKGTLTVDHCTIQNNGYLTSPWDSNPKTLGGGIYSSGDLTVTDSTISNNLANCGGGIYLDNSGKSPLELKAVITDSAISSNGATSGGGGIFNSGGDLTLKGSTISGNGGGYWSGGGIVNTGNLEMVSGTISGNGASGHGGGVVNYGTFTMKGGTISDNTASSGPAGTWYNGLGGGIYNDQGGILNLEGGSISSNYAYDGAGIYNWAGTLFIGGTTQIISNEATGGYGGGIYSNLAYGGSMTFDGTGVLVKSNRAYLPTGTLPDAWYQQYGVYLPTGSPITTNGFTPATQVTDNTQI